MTTLADKARKALEGASQSDKFILAGLAPDLARAYLDLLAERDRLRKAGDNLANAAEHGVAISDAVTAWDNTRAALKQEGDQ